MATPKQTKLNHAIISRATIILPRQRRHGVWAAEHRRIRLQHVRQAALRARQGCKAAARRIATIEAGVSSALARSRFQLSAYEKQLRAREFQESLL